MEEFRQALDEYGRQKRPSGVDVARLVRQVRRAHAAPRSPWPGRLFAYGGWAMAAASLVLFLLRPSDPSTPILDDPARATPVAVAAAPKATEPEPPQSPHGPPAALGHSPAAPPALPPGLPAHASPPPVAHPPSARPLREPAHPALAAPAVAPVASAVPPASPPALASAPPASPPAASAPVAASAPPAASAAPALARLEPEQTLQLGRTHLYRIESVLDVLRETGATSRSTAEQQCFAEHYQKVLSLQGSARDQLRRLEQAAHSADPHAIDLELERLLALRQAADVIYRQGHRCITAP